MFDVLIKNGTIVDGSGAPAFRGDVAVRDGKIAKIAPIIDGEANEVIDAAGLQVTPGFIDSHSHSDRSVFREGGSGSYNYLLQGVTTQVAGQCGSSVAPWYPENAHKYGVAPENQPLWAEHAAMPSDFMKAAGKVHHGTNVAYFIGHSPIRGKVQGFTDALATPEQMKEMQSYVKDAMEAGFLGVSTGLVYAPSVYARTEELIELMKAAAPYGGTYVSHIRGEGNNCLQAVQEAIRIGAESGCPVFISHIKVMGKHNEGLAEKLLAEIDAANARGVVTYADQYPYTASSAPLSSQIPPKYLLGGTDVWLERIKSPEVRRQIVHSIFHEVDEFESGIYHSGFEGALIITAKKTPEWENKTLSEIAQMIGGEPVDALCEVLLANGGSAQGVYFNQSASDLIRLMGHPHVFCGSDTSDHNEFRDPERAGGGHPRSMGTMVRRLELVRDFRLRTMEESVKNLTWDTARALKLPEQGLLKEGWDANICVLDYDRLHAMADYQHPKRRNQGIHHVLVNGAVAVRNGEPTDTRSGKVIKRGT